MILGSDSESTDPEKDRPEVIIESEELMVEIDDFVLLFVDFDDIVVFEGFPHIDEHRPGGRLEPVPVLKSRACYAIAPRGCGEIINYFRSIYRLTCKMLFTLVLMYLTQTK